MTYPRDLDVIPSMAIFHSVRSPQAAIPATLDAMTARGVPYPSSLPLCSSVFWDGCS
jgi:hypothetical protein